MSKSEGLWLVAGLAFIVAAILYAHGWSLDTDAPAIGSLEIDDIRAQTERVKEVTRNVILQNKLLWWGDRLFLFSGGLTMFGILLRRREA